MHIGAAVKMGLLAAAGAGAGQLVEDHSVSLPTLGAIALIVIPATVTISMKLQRLHDRLDSLEAKVDSLPCVDRSKCPEKKV